MFAETCKFDALRVNVIDNVATLLKSCRRGDYIKIKKLYDDSEQKLLLKENIEFGHKVSVNDIQSGSFIYKYGEVIGKSTSDVQQGMHIHVHNVESLRGRGDRKEKNSTIKYNQCFEDKNSKVMSQPLIDLSKSKFFGYPRSDGSVGTRNYVGVISCVACANDVCIRLSDIEDIAIFTHQQGCSQTMPDVEKITQILVNLAKNPNLGAVLLISLGCESVPSNKILESIRATGKPIEIVVIQNEGGLDKSVEKSKLIIDKLKNKIRANPTLVDISKLKIGLKCGSSDSTQGLAANVVVGKLVDSVVAAGATVVIGETTEFMGAEHIATKFAKNQKVAQKIQQVVNKMEQRALAVGVDMRGGQPTRGNIAGGLTTIEEKSLGALAKAGTAVYQDVVAYGELSSNTGLIMMDAPGREPEMLTGLAAAGCNVIIFSTGRGAPQGFPFVPVVKITGNQKTYEKMGQHIDVSVAGILSGTQTLVSATDMLIDYMIECCSGSKSKAEICGYNNSMNIYVTGPVI